MIPQQLALRNFLSYREATLDFQGLTVACISGANGAGKSSLLEAIAWALWGQSRAVTEDDVIYLGALEAQVDFIFTHQQQTYRIVRSRRHSQGSTLEFQVKTDAGFRSLTQRKIRATQQLITEALRLDYETFVNSAYLRQGRADEFMLKRPSERKQILADLLKLAQYDQLSERAKERAREAKAQAALLTASLTNLEESSRRHGALTQELHGLKSTLKTLETHQADDSARLEQHQAVQRQRQQLLQTQTLLQQQLAHSQEVRDRLQQEWTTLQNRQAQLQTVLSQAAEIEAGLGRLRELEAKDEQWSSRLTQRELLQGQHRRLSSDYQSQLQSRQARLQELQLQLTTLDQQRAELEIVLQKRAQLEPALRDLQAARSRLQELDQLHLQVSPLQQRQQHLQRQLDQACAELTARLTVLERSAAQLQLRQGQYPQLQQAVLESSHVLETLTTKRAYQEKVREKGVERRNFMERLQAEQRNYEVQLARIDQKLQALEQANAGCPLCDRPLSSAHRQAIVGTHRQEHEDILKQIWAIREQLAVSEREIQVLRQEYRELDAALADYGQVLEQRGQLKAQLDTHDAAVEELSVQAEERQRLEQRLAGRAYAQEVQTELQQIEAQLAACAYDERDHALARGRVDTLRWVEIRHSEVRQAERKCHQLQIQRPPLQAAITAVEIEIVDISTSSTSQQLAQLEAQLQQLHYDAGAHQRIRAQLKEAHNWSLQHQTLQQAAQALPTTVEQLEVMAQQLERVQGQLTALAEQAQALALQLEQCPDPQGEIELLEQRLSDRQQQRESMLSQVGALEQQLSHLKEQQQQQMQQQQQLQQAQRRLLIHQELAQAFGRNGLQALIIEHILPQLEAETNHILGRLSAHQLHVQFVTQRVGRGRQGKLIDTLDILIADAQGTRPYETYSGGEAFRVNFAIRLALARLLAQRSGTPLQMLIIDEGFGTQDREGCDRLIGAINAISSDFACILAVTHIPHFREAFQTRIDVVKTLEGSRIDVSA